MARPIVTGEEIGALEMLYQQHIDAMVRLRNLAKRRGIESAEFVDADRAAVAYSRQICEIHGRFDQGWTA